MNDRRPFETLLADALERYAMGAPTGVDARALTNTVRNTVRSEVDPSMLHPRWLAPVRGLRLAAVLATLVAALLVVALIGASLDADDAPHSRLLLTAGRMAWVLGPGPTLEASGPVTGRDLCPTLIGGTTVLAGHGFTMWQYTALSADADFPVGDSSFHHPGFEAWSSDGTKVAMGDTGSGAIWILDFGPLADGVTDIEAPEPIPAPGLQWAAWSPDGVRLAVVSTVGGEAALTLRVIDPASGATSMGPVGLPVAAPADDPPVTISWSPDGRRLAVWTFGREGAEQLVRIVGLGSGTVTMAGEGDPDVALADEGAWSPDAGRLALVIGSDVLIVRSDGSQSERFAIDTRLGNVRTARWWPDGRHLLLESDGMLASVEADGSGLTVHVSDPDAVAAFHAGQLYVAHTADGGVLERFDADDTTGTAVPIPGMPSAKGSLCLDAQAPTSGRSSGTTLSMLPWQPTSSATAAPLVADGPLVAYQTATRERDGAHAIHVVRSGGSGATFVGGAVPGGEQLHPDWSPDGGRLLFDVADADGTYDLWIIDAASLAAERIVDCVAPCLWAQEAAWAPDGARIALQRRLETEAGEISTAEVLDLATGESTVVFQTDATKAILAPRWSPDGASLVLEVVALDGGRVVGDSLEVLDLDVPGVTRTLVPMETMANNPDWSPRGDLIAFSMPGEGGEPGGRLSDIWVIAPDGTGMRQVTHLAADGGSAVHPAFTPDGSRILFKGSGGEIGRQDVIASVAIDGSDLGPATGEEYLGGWHPRMRPTPD